MRAPLCDFHGNGIVGHEARSMKDERCFQLTFRRPRLIIVLKRLYSMRFMILIKFKDSQPLHLSLVSVFCVCRVSQQPGATMASSATISSTTQPLSDILPWGAPIVASCDDGFGNSVGSSSSPVWIKSEGRTILVTDATSTDGRFVLHSLALQFLSSRRAVAPSRIPGGDVCGYGDDGDGASTTTRPLQLEGAVLWVSCGPVSEKSVMSGLRKGIQHNLGDCGNGTGVASVGGRSSSAGGGGIGNSAGRISIVSVPLELADAALDDPDADDSGGEMDCISSDLHGLDYLKRLHGRIVHWLNHRELPSRGYARRRESSQSQERTTRRTNSNLGPNVIIIDDVTTLATLLGMQSTNSFISSIKSSLRKHAARCSRPDNATNETDTAHATTSSPITIVNLLALRSTSPDDGGLYQFDDEDGALRGEKLRSEYARLLRPWLGFGSGVAPAIDSPEEGVGTDALRMEEQSNYLCLHPQSTSPCIVHRCGLYEIADCVVDVSPLESGYARDVVGRLSFGTTWNGRGWWGKDAVAVVGASGGSNGNAKREGANGGCYESLCVNYRCDDSGVRVMRLRTR